MRGADIGAETLQGEWGAFSRQEVGRAFPRFEDWPVQVHGRQERASGEHGAGSAGLSRRMCVSEQV